MPRQSHYNQANANLRIDGNPVRGIADGASPIRIDEITDSSVTTQGLDSVETSFSVDLRAEMQVDLLQSSPFLSVINSWRRQQAQGNFQPVNATLMSGHSEIEKMQGVSVKRVGGVKTAGPKGEFRTVIFNVERWLPDESGNPTIDVNVGIDINI